MSRYFSPSECGFFSEAIHGVFGEAGCTIPADGVLTDDALYAALLEAQMGGQMIVAGPNGAPVAVNRPGPTAAQLWTAYQRQAQAALSDSDITMLRCIENAVAVPAAWSTYRVALRAIVGAASGDPTQALPAKPAYPAGT